MQCDIVASGLEVSSQGACMCVPSYWRMCLEESIMDQVREGVQGVPRAAYLDIPLEEGNECAGPEEGRTPNKS